MKLYLFGGAEIQLNQAQPLKNLIKKTILQLHPKSVLHIPYARLNPTEVEWHEGWFKETMKDTGVEIFDVRTQGDVQKATNPLIFINGGPDRSELINGIDNNIKVLNLILQAEYVVGESAGSMVIGEYLRVDKVGHEITRGLGILKDTIIEPHYSERNYRQMLKDEMKETNVKYGIGIDCVTAIVVDPLEFPSKWNKIGDGSIDMQIAENQSGLSSMNI